MSGPPDAGPAMKNVPGQPVGQVLARVRGTDAPLESRALRRAQGLVDPTDAAAIEKPAKLLERCWPNLRRSASGVDVIKDAQSNVGLHALPRTADQDGLSIERLHATCRYAIASTRQRAFTRQGSPDTWSRAGRRS